MNDDYTTSEVKTANGPPPEPTGAFLGTVGVRSAFTVRVLRILSLGIGEYGEKFLCVMDDPYGNRLVWFTGENLALDEGKDYQITASVKGHSVYNGRRQTVLQRVKEKKSG